MVIINSVDNPNIAAKKIVKSGQYTKSELLNLAKYLVLYTDTEEAKSRGKNEKD